MKRWRAINARTIVFLLLGAIVNVAVAWAFAIWNPLLRNIESSSTRHFIFYSDAMWFVSRQTTFGAVYFHSTTDVPPDMPADTEYADAGGRTPSGGVPMWIRSHPGDPRTFVYAREGAWGWPIAALSLSATIVYHGPEKWEDVFLFKPPRADKAWALPTRPLWSAFAINTVFYAGILWLLFAMPFALRRRRRIKRGLCPKCAYPVGNSSVCTECGAAVRSMRDKV